MVGAAALVAGATHTLSTVVLVLELTNQQVCSMYVYIHLYIALCEVTTIICADGSFILPCIYIYTYIYTNTYIHI